MAFYDYGATVVTLPSEIVPDRTVTKEEWAKATTFQDIDNMTVVLTQTQDGETTTYTGKVDGNKMYSCGLSDGVANEYYFEISDRIVGEDIPGSI